jgi:hypothetical protein
MKTKNNQHHPVVSTPSIPSTPPTTADENAQQVFLWHTHDYLANYARFADTKAAFVGTLSGALIGALYSARLLTPLGHEHWKTWPLAVWLALSGSATLATSILFALRAVYPRLKSAGAQGYIFWENIAAFASFADLATSFEAQTTKTLNAQLLRQNHDISRHVCIPKYRNVSLGIITLFIGGLLTAAALLTQAALPALSVPPCPYVVANPAK